MENIARVFFGSLLVTLVAWSGGCGGGGGYPLSGTAGGSGGVTPGGRGGASGGTFGGPTAGSFGPGGSPGGDPCIVTPVPTNCGGGLCGNGVRDTCLIRAAFDACPEVRFTEVCDGAEFGAVSCEDHGYAGGTLTCSSFCQTIDTSRCTECKPLDAWLRSCGDAPLTATTGAAAIAATDTEVALAWLQFDSNNTPMLGFARLTPSLGVISSAFITDPSVAMAWGVQIAPLPSGWVVTGFNDPEVFVQTFDAAGQPDRRTTVSNTLGSTLNYTPVLASRPNGGPLVVWGTDDTIRAAVIGADGRSSTAPVDVAAEDFYGGQPSAVFSGDAFYVAYSIVTASDDVQLRLARIEVDGRVTAPFNGLPGVSVIDASLVAGADDLRVVYPGRLGISTPDMEIWSMLWQRMDATGAAASAPVVLSGGPDLSGWGRGVAFGRDTVVLLRASDQTPWMGIARVAGDGSFVMPLRKVAIGAQQSNTFHELIRRGSDAIVLWISANGRIQLARVAM